MDTLQRVFDEVYESTYDYVLKFVIAKCDNLSNVEDIMQSIYIKFYVTIEKDHTYVNNPKGFLIKLAKNELFSYYSLKNKLKLVLLGSIDNEKDDFIENVVDEEINIEEDFIRRFNNDRIWQIIKEEKLVNQRILALHFLEDMKLSEIASILKLPESTVKSKLYRSLSKVKVRLEEGNYE